MKEQTTQPDRLPDMAMSLANQSMRNLSGSSNYVTTGERLYGIWMQDGNFYFPMSQRDGKTAVYFGGRSQFGPIVED